MMAGARGRRAAVRRVLRRALLHPELHLDGPVRQYFVLFLPPALCKHGLTYWAAGVKMCDCQVLLRLRLPRARRARARRHVRRDHRRPALLPGRQSAGASARASARPRPPVRLPPSASVRPSAVDSSTSGVAVVCARVCLRRKQTTHRKRGARGRDDDRARRVPRRDKSARPFGIIISFRSLSRVVCTTSHERD